MIGKLYLFHFATKATVNSGQTFPVDTYTPSTKDTTTGIVGIQIFLLN